MVIPKLRFYSKPPQFVVTEILVACCLGLMLGVVSILTSPIWAMLIIAGCVLTIAVFKMHELLLLMYLILTSTIVGGNINPHVSLGFGNIYLTDIIIFVSFGLIIIRSFAEPDFKLIRTRLDLPLMLFWATAIVSTFNVILQSNVTLRETLGPIRVINSYLTFFIVTNLIRKERQVSLLWKGLFVFAVITVIAMVAQYSLGNAVRILPGRVEVLSTEGVGFEDITRIIPPGESIIFFVFIFITVSIVLKNARSTGIENPLTWGALGLGLILTYKRHLFIAFSIDVLILFFLLNPRGKARLLTWGIVFAIVLSILVFVVSSYPESKAMEFVKASSDRYLSVTTSQTYLDPDSSFQWRTFEYEYAIPQIESHPMLGLGLGTIYRPFVQGRDYSSEINYSGGDFRRFVHNGHLAILLRTGLLGYLFFVWLSISFIYQGFKYWRDIPDVNFQALVLSLMLAYIGILIGSIISPIILTGNWTPVLGIAFGTNEVVYKIFDVNNLSAEMRNAELIE